MKGTGNGTDRTDRTDVPVPENARSCWGTPRALFDLLNAEFHFNVDGAAKVENSLCDGFLGRGMGYLKNRWLEMADGRRCYCLGDAFGYEGQLGDRIFLNPPYGGRKAGERPIGEWVALAMGWCRAGALVVLWLPSDVETGWYCEGWRFSREVRALRGRVSHVRDGGLGEGVDRPRGGTSVFVFDPWKRESEGPGRWWVWEWKGELGGEKIGHGDTEGTEGEGKAGEVSQKGTKGTKEGGE